MKRFNEIPVGSKVKNILSGVVYIKINEFQFSGARADLACEGDHDYISFHTYRGYGVDQWYIIEEPR